MQKAIADSAAEERDKDHRMWAAATAQAEERIARDTEQASSESIARSANESATNIAAGAADALQRYTARLRQSTSDGESVQLRNATLSTNGKGMCAEFNAKDRTGSFAGFKRVVVTETRATVEEAPTRETLTQFLLFQLAARDTGCFPDVQSVRILQ